MNRAALLKLLRPEAKRQGYEIATNSNQYLVMLRKVTEQGDRIQVAVYWSDKTAYTGQFTVATAINHPKKGKTQLYRKGLPISAVFKLMENPRLHTGRGYYER